MILWFSASVAFKMLQVQGPLSKRLELSSCFIELMWLFRPISCQLLPLNICENPPASVAKSAESTGSWKDSELISAGVARAAQEGSILKHRRTTEAFPASCPVTVGTPFQWDSAKMACSEIRCSIILYAHTHTHIYIYYIYIYYIIYIVFLHMYT